MFATLTFRAVKHYTDRHTGKVVAVNRTGANGSMHPEAADKAFRYFVSCVNREVYGPKWNTRWHRGIQWARGSEFHKDGRLHFHALLSAPTADLNHLISRYAWHEWWYREFGRNQLEQPRSQHQVADYVSKYVVKDGQVDLSPNFGAWQPARPDYAVAPQQRDLVGVSHDEPTTGGLMQASRWEGTKKGRPSGHGP
ncbi:rolling circle replication-associated protein [Lysobacter sp. 1R34A]|uniref:rolling circle replication-associated protein n=1 Tax=Lysobacter sp. 1R34A TaxID=3445786 RepID=UPI003EE86614